MADLEYTSSLDDDAIRAGLKRIEVETKNAADTLEKEFNSATGGIDKAASAMEQFGATTKKTADESILAIRTESGERQKAIRAEIRAIEQLANERAKADRLAIEQVRGQGLGKDATREAIAAIKREAIERKAADKEAVQGLRFRLREQKTLEQEAVRGIRAQDTIQRKADKEAVQALKQRIAEQKQLSNLSKKLDRDLSGSDKGGAGGSALAIGGAAGAVAELTRRIVDLGVEAAKTFANIVQGGVEINQRLEDAGKVFSAVFGDPNIGQDVIKFLDQTADRLNIDKDLAIQFGRSILPRTDSLENFTELLRLTDIQADATGKSVGELEFAIREALTGDFVSLKDQFDIGRVQIDQIKALTPELGASGALAKVLGDEFERLGKVNVQGTLTTDIKAVQAQFSELQQVLGEPVFEVQKELIASIGDVLNEREADFKEMAGAVGDVVAAILDFIGSGIVDFLQNLDTERVTELAGGILELVEKLRTLTEIASEGALGEALLADLDTAIFAIQKINEAIETAQKLFGLLRGVVQQVQAEQAAIDAGASRGEARAKGQEAFNQSIQETLKSLEGEKDRLDASRQAAEDRAAAQADGTNVDEAAIDAKLKSLSAENELTEATKRGEEATKKASEAEKNRSAALKEAAKIRENQAKAETDLQDKLEEIEEKGIAERLKLEQGFAQNRVKIARDNAADIEKINRDFDRAVEDATKDSSRQAADLAKDQAQARGELEKDLAKKRVEIEESAAKQLEDIQRNLERSQSKAARSRDAVAFLEAGEQAGVATEDVTRNRDEALEQLKTEGETRREELRAQQELERLELQESEQRKLEDLELQHERKLEDQRAAAERELAELTISENQKREELTASLKQREEDAKASYEKQQKDLDEALAKQLASIRRFGREARSARDGAEGGDSENSESSPSSRPIRGVNLKTFNEIIGKANLPGFASGGRPRVLEPSIVGERGPELFVPDSAGSIIPNNQVLPNLLPPSIGGSTVDNSRAISLNQGILDPSSITPTVIAIARQQALQVYEDVINGAV